MFHLGEMASARTPTRFLSKVVVPDLIVPKNRQIFDNMKYGMLDDPVVRKTIVSPIVDSFLCCSLCRHSPGLVDILAIVALPAI